MLNEIGHYALVLAFALALVQAALPMLGAARRDAALMATGGPSAVAQFGFVAIAFAVLAQAYLVSDFSLENVAENSNSAMPWYFRLSAVWGNHEGSMLLWVLILALFGALVAVFGRNLPAPLKANVLGVQSWVASAFLLFILVTSNPFARLQPAPMEGRDLNPVLQDFGLAIHPPLLYLGYVGLSISFAFAVAALIEGRLDAAWARWVRPWTLTAWCFLTLGIAMGSYWAYYELGWGGWWFWDPVENASFMPWLAATALLHSAIVMEKRNALKVWTVLLAILAFSLSLLGTFLVRSGVLTSVHAFASDPTRGVFILAILAFFIGGSLTLFAWRAPMLAQGGIFAPISREGALVFNNLFLTVSCAAVLIGTLLPLVFEAFGDKISVGAPFFDLVFGALMLPLLVAVPFGPLLAWKRGDLLGAAERLVAAFALTLVLTAILWWFHRGGPLLALVGVALAIWLMAGSLSEIALRLKLFAEPAGALRRAAGLPRSAWGTAFAHFGVGVTLLGIVAEASWKTEDILVMLPGETTRVAGFELTFEGTNPLHGDNYQETMATFTVRKDGQVVATLHPAKRFYPVRQMPTTEAAIETFVFSQLYMSLGDAQANGGYAMRIYYKPFVTLIWLGAVVMAFGGLVSLTDRRLRVGAPKPARSVPPRAGTAPAAAE
jgi:cytochrome c-type biogenesis protein CcmF